MLQTGLFIGFIVVLVLVVVIGLKVIRPKLKDQPTYDDNHPAMQEWRRREAEKAARREFGK